MESEEVWKIVRERNSGSQTEKKEESVRAIIKRPLKKTSLYFFRKAIISRILQLCKIFYEAQQKNFWLQGKAKHLKWIFKWGVNSETEHVENNWLLGDVFIEEEIRNLIKQKIETSAIFKLYDLSSNFENLY